MDEGGAGGERMKRPTALEAWKQGKKEIFIEHYDRMVYDYLGGRSTSLEFYDAAHSCRQLAKQFPNKKDQKNFLISFRDHVEEMKEEIGFIPSK
jgi:hypothetical protein